LYIQRVRGAAPIDTSEIEPGSPSQDVAVARIQMNRRYPMVYPAKSNRTTLAVLLCYIHMAILTY
jgi:hypothetical protein